MSDGKTPNYPGNSHKARIERKKEMNEITKDQEAPQEKKVEKVISGTAKTRKKGLGRKIAETFTGDDTHSVGEYILFDVIIPAAKAMISDAASQGVERLLFGDTSRRASSPARGTHTSYNRMYTPNREDRPSGPRQMSTRGRATHDFNEVVLSTRAEAEEVLDCLTDLIATYGVASVSDLYELVGITGAFTDDKWGWADITHAHVSTIRGGYLLNLPKPAPLD